LSKPYIEELTVFINVRIPNLNASSILILKIENIDVITSNEITNINIERKYLFMSFCSIFVSIRGNLVVYTLLGFEYESISFNEYLNRK
tara:strand:- start:233 stop:499 length:267 start_codon:yes stop_codon:yes gene_type:complete